MGLGDDVHVDRRGGHECHRLGREAYDHVITALTIDEQVVRLLQRAEAERV